MWEIQNLLITRHNVGFDLDRFSKAHKVPLWWWLWMMLYLILSLSFGVLLAEIVTGRPNGPLSSLTNYPNQKFPSLFIGSYHIHHWMWCLPLSLILFQIGQLEIAAFFVGCCLQGLTYGDRFHIKEASEWLAQLVDKIWVVVIYVQMMTFVVDG